MKQYHPVVQALLRRDSLELKFQALSVEHPARSSRLKPEAFCPGGTS